MSTDPSVDASISHGLVPIRILARVQRGSERLLANLVGVGADVAVVEADGLLAGDIITVCFFVPGASESTTLPAVVEGALDEHGTLHTLTLDQELPEAVKDMMLKRGGATT